MVECLFFLNRKREMLIFIWTLRHCVTWSISTRAYQGQESEDPTPLGLSFPLYEMRRRRRGQMTHPQPDGHSCTRSPEPREGSVLTEDHRRTTVVLSRTVHVHWSCSNRTSDRKTTATVSTAPPIRQLMIDRASCPTQTSTESVNSRIP